MANATETFLKYANLQIAAESLFGVAPSALPGVTSDQMSQASLIDGNGRSSKFPSTLAEQLINLDKWTLLEHKSNTATGFGGTLFRNTQTSELVLSFRSTEFADDAVRDNMATNTLELKETGWAFGQIADMEQRLPQLPALTR